MPCWSAVLVVRLGYTVARAISEGMHGGRSVSVRVRRILREGWLAALCRTLCLSYQ